MPWVALVWSLETMEISKRSDGYVNVGTRTLTPSKISRRTGVRKNHPVGSVFDFALFRALQGMIKIRGASLSEDITLKARVLTQQSKILRGRQIIWTMI